MTPAMEAETMQTVKRTVQQKRKGKSAIQRKQKQKQNLAVTVTEDAKMVKSFNDPMDTEGEKKTPIEERTKAGKEASEKAKS